MKVIKFNNHIRRITATIIALWLIALSQMTCTNVEQSKKMEGAKRKIFGVELRPKATELLTEVETYYRKPVKEEIMSGWENYHLGESYVASDGTPVIQVNASAGRTEENIVHELFHLKLRAEGFAELAFEPLHGGDNRVDESLMRTLGFYFRDPIQHSIIYPEMRKMGFDPDAGDRAVYELFLQRDKFKGISNSLTPEESLIIHYFKASLEISDKNLLARIERWYVNNGWENALMKGKELADTIVQAKPLNPEREINLFVNCMNSLLQGVVQFRFRQWETKNLGAHKQQIAVIQILPVSK